MEDENSIAEIPEREKSRIEKFFDPLAGTLGRARRRNLIKGDGVSLSLMGLGTTLFGLGVAQVLESGGDPGGWTGALYMAISTINVYNAQGASRRAEDNLKKANERIEGFKMIEEVNRAGERRLSDQLEDPRHGS